MRAGERLWGKPALYDYYTTVIAIMQQIVYDYYMEEDFNFDEAEKALTSYLEVSMPVSTGRPKIPETLSDVLVTQLKPTQRVQIAKSLIDIAINGPKASDKLAAIKEIYDRVEGKSRQRVETKTAEDDPLLATLNKLYTDPDKKYSSGPYIDAIDGDVKELD